MAELSKAELIDDGCPERIREFIRRQTDIHIYENIQKGLNGVIYFGQRKKLNDHVVLKFNWGSADFDSSEEAVILKSIDHPNILKVHDLRFVPPHYTYFLSPKIDGGDLQNYIDGGSVPTKEALELMAGMLGGVTALHSTHHMVHRDLKPPNILLDKKTNAPVIADLGAVKHIADATGHVTASKATKHYLPPEAVTNNEYYFQSDIYQLGIIFYQLLGGFFPVNNEVNWLNDKEKAIIDGIRNNEEQSICFDEMLNGKICNGKIADRNKLPSYLDLRFKKALSKALNIDSTKRFQSAAEFLREIHQLQRLFPSYHKMGDFIYVIHQSGKQYRLWETPNSEYSLEMLTKKGWIRKSGHNGSLQSILELSRKN